MPSKVFKLLSAIEEALSRDEADTKLFILVTLVAL